MSDEHQDWRDEAVKVVKNDQGVCSIWPADREDPAGWQDVGFSGSKEECLEFVKQHCDGNCRLVDSAVSEAGSSE